MKLWHFESRWDYHETGGFLVMASSAASAAKRLNKWMGSPESRDKGREYFYWPGAYGKPELGTWTADDAKEAGPVFVVPGCDD